jgi:uncharacterized membrane protein YagU involved in acid resistance
VRVANAALGMVGQRLTDPQAKRVAGEFVHLAFGAINGAIYGVAAELEPRVTAAGGVPFGAGLWAVADEGMVPALGLSRGPREVSAGLLAYGLLSHFVYGMTTECVRQALLERANSRPAVRSASRSDRSGRTGTPRARLLP